MGKRLGKLNPQGLLGLAVDETPAADKGPLEVPGYEIRSVLGRGAAGVVYEAFELEENRLVALKLLSDEHASDELQRERLAREAKSMAALSHPNLVEVYGFLTLENTVGIAMEIVSGATLRHRIREVEEMEIEEAVQIVSSIGDALQVVHDANLTHRDLKPENVLLNEEGNVKVTDFGIAFSEDDAIPRLTLTGMTLGTIGYMSPEQADGLTVDFRSDIYSLGVILHELLTGESPDGFLEPPRLYRREMPEEINDAVVKALSPEPGDRFASVLEFTRAVDSSKKKNHRINPFRKSK